MDSKNFLSTPVAEAGKAPLQPAQGFGGKQLLSLTGDKTVAEKQKLEILAKEFESLFIQQMIKSMRSTINKSGLIDGGSGEEIFTGMMDEEMGRQIAFAQHDGLSTALVSQLSTMLKDAGAKDPAGQADANKPPENHGLFRYLKKGGGQKTQRPHGSYGTE